MARFAQGFGRVSGLAVVIMLAVPCGAWANTQEAHASRGVTFEADFFAPFAPTNALDIVRRVPGFVLEEGAGDVRGFSGTAGNVVFNGTRSSSKAERLETLLARIPARRVLRVEVAPGDRFGSDFAGRSQVLNVVLSTEAGIDGNVKLSLARNWRGHVAPNAEGSVLIKRGTTTFNLSAGTDRNDFVEEGYDRVSRLSDGVQTELRRKHNFFKDHEPFISASWGREDAADRAAHLNLRFARSTFDLMQTNVVTPLGGALRDDRLFEDYLTETWEVGGDVTRPLARGAMKLVFLANRRDRRNFDAAFNRNGGVTFGGFEQTSDSRYDEVLGRLSWTRGNLLGLSVELGSEVAYNRLENGTALFLLGPGGLRTPIDLPVDNATVDEFRTETYVNAGRGLGKGWRMDASLAFETSRLTVAGDTSARRSLRFLKPGFTLEWKPGGGWRAQASLRRKVAQLDFYDFLSSAELASDRINGGNADLLPQRSWEARLTVEKAILGDGLLKLDLGVDRVSGLQDRVLTADGFDAPGNLGAGRREFSSLTIDAPLARLGARSMRLRLDGTVQHSRVHDPLSHHARPWSGYWPRWQWSAELRRDKGAFSVGTTVQDRAPFAFHRIDEIDTNFNNRPFAVVFAEYRPDKRTTLRLDVDNALDTTGSRRRLFFTPNRSAPAPVAAELRDRNTHVGLILSLNRTFGA